MLIIDYPPPDNHVVVPKMISERTPNYAAALQPLFGSPTIMQTTFENMTQYAHIPCSTRLKRTFKSHKPALNGTRRNESVANGCIC